jgi:protein gp37
MVKRFPHLHGFDNPNAAGIRPLPFSTIQFHPDRLDQPLHWKKPRRIFVCSMGDLFHEGVSDDQILSVWMAMGEFYDAKGKMQPYDKRPHHTYLVLTKRPERMRDFLKSRYPEHFQRPNVWLGVTAENQEMADQRIPILLQTPAEKRFVSVEPMLGPVDLAPYLNLHWRTTAGIEMDAPQFEPRLSWVICGGESGPSARPMALPWAQALRDQCISAGVPFFFKQWGAWAPGPLGHSVKMRKKTAGCLLDGRAWKEFPEVTR